MFLAKNIIIKLILWIFGFKKIIKFTNSSLSKKKVFPLKKSEVGGKKVFLREKKGT